MTPADDAQSFRPAQPRQALELLRPGERLVAGKPYVFDLDAVNAYEADRAVEGAPADLSRLPDREIDRLWTAGLNCIARRRAEPGIAEFFRRVCAERHTRPLSAAERGVAA